MTFSPPPRRVPVTVVFGRVKTLSFILFMVLFGQWLFIPARNSMDVLSKSITAGVLILVSIAYAASVWRSGGRYLELLRNGEVVNARLVSCRITYLNQWFPIEDFPQHWQPYHGRPRLDDGSAFVVESIPVECEFEFRARGNVVRCRDRMKMNLHIAERAVEPVIFLPSKPVVCRLVQGLPLQMQIQLVA